MALAALRDDNNQAFTDPSGLRPDFATAVSATTGAGITESSIAGLNVAANKGIQGEVMLMVTVATNPCYFSLGVAGAVPGTNGPMMIVPSNFPIYLKAKSTDVSCYHQQITGAGSLKVVALV